MCQPGLSIDEYLSTARPETRPIFERVSQHLAALDGDLIVDPLSSKVLFKNGPVIATLESMTKWVALGFTLRRRLESTRMSRKVTEYQGKYWHVLNLTDADQLDDELLAWLTEAFYRDSAPPSIGGDPMVPDDLDDDYL